MPNSRSFRTLEDFFHGFFLEKVILYGEKSFFSIFFFFSAIRVVPQNSSAAPQKDTSIAGLRMFVAFLVFAKAPGK